MKRIKKRIRKTILSIHLYFKSLFNFNDAKLDLMIQKQAKVYLVDNFGKVMKSIVVDVIREIEPTTLGEDRIKTQIKQKFLQLLDEKYVNGKTVQ